MQYDIGKRIKELRLKWDMTQEMLSSSLNLSPQAVSKWENGATLPDIALLPELSVLFGVSIDELFSLSVEARFERIENMLEMKDFPSEADYAAAESFLTEKLQDAEHRGSALTLLADLCNHRAAGYHRLAEGYARRALDIDPEKKDNHRLLRDALGGISWDWCASNHHELIAYYQDFVKKHPDYHSGYLWLLDNLVTDRRLDEAEEAAEQMRRVKDTFHYPLYQGHIAAIRGDFQLAEAYWAKMVDQYPDTWLSWSSRADAYAKYGRYDEAIRDYKRAIEVHKPPRFVDNYLSIALIATIQKDWALAADSYRNVLALLRDDWGMTEGDGIERYRALLNESLRLA